MSVRIVLTVTAKPGKGSEMAEAYRTRSVGGIQNEPGYEQYEVFQGVDNPDRLVILERWTDEAALHTHEEFNRTHPLMVLRELRVAAPDREDYVYNRTR
jgi:quinol monooxygenase YgiN